MKIAAFADLHAHPFESFAHTLEGGINSRLADCIKALEEIIKYCRENDIRHIINAGDTFHVKSIINVTAFNAVFRVISQADDLKWHMIPGNHDFATEDGKEHSLEAFSVLRHVNIYNTPAETTYTLHGESPLQLTFIPFIRNKKELAKTLREMPLYPRHHHILVGHQYISDLTRLAFKKEGDFEAKDLAAWDMVLMGHYHVHGIVETTPYAGKRGASIISIGAPLQHNFGDRGHKKGFVVIDTEELTCQHIPIKTAPAFKAFEGVSAIIPEDVAGHFVRVRVTGEKEAKRARMALEKAGASDYTIEMIPTSKEARIELDPGLDDAAILKKYISSEWGATTLDPDELLKVGLEYLKGAIPT